MAAEQGDSGAPTDNPQPTENMPASQLPSQTTSQPTPDVNNMGTGEVEQQCIINEVLCFMSNKINTMPYEMITKLCMDFYTDENIVAAKDVLFNTAVPHIDGRTRNIKRRGPNMRQSNIQDMLNVFLEISPQSVPCYVCKDLTQLPPLTMNNFDMSSVVRDLEALKLQLQILQEAQETNLAANLAFGRDSLQPLVTGTSSAGANAPSNTPVDTTEQEPENTLPKEVTPNTSNTQGTAPQGEDTAVKTTLEATPQEEDTAVKSDTSNTEDNMDSSQDDMGANDNDLLLLANIPNETARVTPKTNYKKSYVKALIQPKKTNMQSQNKAQAPPLRSNTSSSAGKHHTGRQLQQNSDRKRHRSGDVIIGTGQNFSLRTSGKVSVKGRPQTQLKRSCTGIFLSRFPKNTRPQNIVQHVQQETGLRVKCEALQTKFPTYRSFCVRLPQSQHSRLLDPTVWPEGALVKRYYESVN